MRPLPVSSSRACRRIPPARLAAPTGCTKSSTTATGSIVRRGAGPDPPRPRLERPLTLETSHASVSRRSHVPLPTAPPAPSPNAQFAMTYCDWHVRCRIIGLERYWLSHCKITFTPLYEASVSATLSALKAREVRSLHRQQSNLT